MVGELPPDAKALLALARDADNPPPEARAQVRRATAAAIATSTGAQAGKVEAGSAAAKGLGRGPLGWLGPRGSFLVVSAALGGTLWFGWQGQPREASRTAPIVAPVTAPQPALEPLFARAPEPKPVVETLVVRERVPTPAAETRRAVRASTHHVPAKDSLAAEIELLRSASKAIDAERGEQALRLLHAYRTQFARPIMSEERDGLTVLAKCLVASDSARADAALFLKRSPRSVLAARVERTCRLAGSVQPEPSKVVP